MASFAYHVTGVWSRPEVLVRSPRQKVKEEVDLGWYMRKLLALRFPSAKADDHERKRQP